MSRWIFVTVVTLVVGLVGSGTALALDGSGTEGDPWRIQSLADFNDFAADANYWDDYTRLETDVNLAGRVYSRAVIAWDVNDVNDGFQGTAFKGVFDGNDHKIIGLTIDDAGAGNDYLGLFGSIGEDGQISNLGIEGGSVSGDGVVGGLVGLNWDGSVSNCYSTGDVNGRSDVGGLVGWNFFGSISNCYSTGGVSGTGCVGGLVGYNSGSILNCCSTGYASGGGYVGGLVGYNGDDGIVSNCYSTSDVSGHHEVGGLVGCNEGSVSNCYSTGLVSGGHFVGGLVGLNWDGSVSNCYSTGDVNGRSDVGGLVGLNEGSVSNCFWDIDKQTHGVTESIGDDEGTVTNVSGLTTAQMQKRSTFTDAGWDFINVWAIGENQTYPYLRTVPAGDINKDGIVNFLDVAILAEKWMGEE